MSKISEMIKDSSKTYFTFSLFLLIPIFIISLFMSPPDIVFKIWPWATSFFSLGHSFFGGLAVSLTSMLLMLWSFDFINSLRSMLKVDYDAINGKRVMLISSSLFCIFFIIWFSSFFGMLYSTFPLSDNMYMLRHIGVLSSATPLPIFIYHILVKFFKEAIFNEKSKDDSSEPLVITVVLTIALVVLYAKFS